MSPLLFGMTPSQAGMSLGVAFCLLGPVACGDDRADYKPFGIPLNPIVSAPNVALARGDGAPFAIGAQRGKASLVFFGYTNCPDICPTTLADWKQVKAALGNDADRVNFVFVTVDPANDTPEVVRAYVAKFDSSFVGLSGEPAQIDSVSKTFGVSAFADGTLDSGHPAMAHPSRVYLVDPEARIRFVYPPGLKPQEIAEDVKHVL